MSEERGCVLYVEDDPSSATLVQRVLAAEGYKVVVADNGFTAIEVAQRSNPVIILMDINLGGLDGYEVTTRLRSVSSLQNVPIVAVTAATTRGDRERALIAGCDGYISKPIDVDTFPDQVSAFLGGKRERLESAEKEVEYLVEYSRRLVERLEEKIYELEKANAELQKTDKMRTDFVILAGHELRTPLTAVYGYAQLLLSNPNIPGEPDDMGSPRFVIEKMAIATQRLGQVVEDILNVSLIDANRLDLSLVPVRPSSLIQNVVRSIQGSAQDRKLNITMEGLDDLPAVSGDSKRLHQAFWNIISNAVKYTPDGGSVAIKGRVISDTVHVQVQDTGIGIDPEEKERVFERFYVLENVALHRSSKTAFKGGGLGVGLTVARGIIEAHGGKVWVESEGRDEERLPGSTFHVLLPILKEPWDGKPAK